ncbi:YbjQ family protein [Ktedonosporobacter rubrisoli]|uniref:UPF0145 protein EPA93_44955 n=1 Tax=Ktedonosporobacter rubrisoli TaxID=2509675 RepID=A0A4P6K3A9_KTERU|nr:YbjQ family protein [Ktedonosporobacter rubrisoli]QBD82738.1 YbjQ family protein [Ktedonosporobacter rubrisoli]
MYQRTNEQSDAYDRKEQQASSTIEQYATTAFELPGLRIVSNHGVVRGIIVRSRSIVGQLGAAFQSVKGGNITLYTKLCEDTRRDAFELMIKHATEVGANAIIGIRYDANELGDGVTEVLCYGTAVSVAPLN